MKHKNIDQTLFEDMSTQYMEMFHFPPLTANIFTFLMFDLEHEGTTFEDILEATCASKSSVSNTLNRLLQSNHIEYYSKLGERKRYYRINKAIFNVQFRDTIRQLKKHKEILERYAAHRYQILEEKDEHSEKINLHINLQENTINLFEETLEKLNQITK